MNALGPLVVATTNPHKVDEIRVILSELQPGLEVAALPEGLPPVDEPDTTLEGNAMLKAIAACSATGRMCLADDSGLYVDALDGAPGVRSARYAGDDANAADNRVALLAALSDHHALGWASVAAHFRTAVAIVVPDGTFGVDRLVCTARIDGYIVDVERGDADFGYDRLFVPEVPANPRHLTFAEMPSEMKSQISHRRMAVAGALRLAAAAWT